MSIEATREIMTAYLRALGKRGPLARYFANDVTFTVMGGGQQVRGPIAVEEFINWFHTQAFDARPELKEPIVVDGQAALEAEFVGLHTGEFFGVPASHRSVRVPYSVVYDLRDGLITALRLYMPMNVLMEQISTPASPEVVGV